MVGAHAAAFHARPRATKDLDLLLDPSRENAEKALEALRDFFGGTEVGYAKGCYEGEARLRGPLLPGGCRGAGPGERL